MSPLLSRTRTPAHATSAVTCCPEGAALASSRRGFLQGAALVGTTIAVGSSVVTFAGSAAAATAGSPVVVVLSLRGAADGLSLVVPHADPAYYAARPTLAVPKASLLAQDAMFGLHPALAPLLPLWNAGRLAAVHATGLPVANRSHFAAMEALEDADPGSSERVGWLNRMIGVAGGTDPMLGLAIGSLTPTSLAGPAAGLTLTSLEESLAADPSYRSGPRRTSLDTMWAGQSGPMAQGMRSALATTTPLATALAQPDTSASYGTGPQGLGRALATVARTIKSGVGLSAVTVDHGDWDMHADLGTPAAGRLRTNATELATALAAFFADLGPAADRVTLVTISEFGRRVAENANAGADHGWGNVMLLAGAGVKGGRYYGRWPGLTNSLDADLPVTTDYRSVLAEVVATRTTASTATVFPGFAPETIGVMSRV
ncbi:DUF1501 domain-containing protein [Nocardioides sp. TRM66260-LWL]|uniref:DUF1501 domain-containing protein n=1 Tax=Nocardioides sp. TRM66260-LWL TaxID=2874478 RepID=UPI001CC3B6C8|nr:DUF1501 domain-containing protein [Nocardioides sp. TRM66260-LWL]MBZ5734460.1 DUF1501 domain-containing protein [Nocardioides sp. TRM66260-LWL]